MERISPAARLKDLPQVQRLLETAEAKRLLERLPRRLVLDALRAVLEEARQHMLRAQEPLDPPSVAELLARAGARAAAAERPLLRRVVNATGIVLHTNLGRAPLAAEAVAAVTELARGYANLEFDLDSGRRGARAQGLEELLCAVCGAEAGLAVNNAAAAVLLALGALAAGGEVVVSRGELVEIGGGFRIPDVIRHSGARLVEVGTTNKTRLSDYRAAIGAETRVLLKVHQSNYRIIGFTAEVGLAELSGLAREKGLVLMQDLGSGALLDLRRLGRAPEPTVQDALAAGADLVVFSGDKVMGGPQAGLLVGREAVLAPLRRHPLFRALRLDKMSLAALEATLRLYRDPETAMRAVPVLRMLAQDEAVLAARAERLCAALAASDGTAIEARIEATTAFAGGGSLPETAVASRAVSLAGAIPAQELAARLRHGSPAVIGRVAAGRLVLDMLSVADDEVAEIAAALRGALAS